MGEMGNAGNGKMKGQSSEDLRVVKRFQAYEIPPNERHIAAWYNPMLRAPGFENGLQSWNTSRFEARFPMVRKPN